MSMFGSAHWQPLRERLSHAAANCLVSNEVILCVTAAKHVPSCWDRLFGPRLLGNSCRRHALAALLLSFSRLEIAVGSSQDIMAVRVSQD